MHETDWFKNAIIYHILIDRFSGFSLQKHWEKPEFIGGTLQGITEKLPYLKDLGITTIWISPFYQTSAYHGYHITNFFQVDPRYGTVDDLKQLIHQTHQYKMKIITDFVPNHCSKQHPFFQEAVQDKHSSYQDWFVFTRWPDKYLCFLSIQELPKLNLSNPDTKNHIISAANYWLSFGFDGYRLDHVIGLSPQFWKEFHKEIKTAYPHAVLIGEAWMQGIKRKELQTINVPKKYLKWMHGAASDSLLKDYVGLLDGVLDFTVQKHIHHHIVSQQTSPQTFSRLLRRHYKRFPDSFFLPAFLDNHDMDRFLFVCNNNKEKLKQAIQLQFSLPQPVIIYYGTEAGMTQNKSLWSCPVHGDLQARQPMKWDNSGSDLFRFYQQVIASKKETDAFKT